MSNQYPPPGEGQDPHGESQPPPPPPSEPQWNPQSPGTPPTGTGSEPGYGQPGYGQPGSQLPSYEQPSYEQPSYQQPGQAPGVPGGYGGYAGYGQPVQTSPLAIVSLVLGIVGLLCCTFFALGIGAVVTGFLARKQINESQGRMKGSGMALAGLILGITSIVLALVYWVLVIAGAINTDFNFQTT